MQIKLIHKIGVVSLLSFFLLTTSAADLQSRAKLFVKFDEAQNELPVEYISGEKCLLTNQDQQLGEATADKIFGTVRSFSDPDGAKANRLRTPQKIDVSGRSERTYAFWINIASDKNYYTKFIPTHPKSALNFQNVAQIFSTGNVKDDMNGFMLIVQSRRHIKLTVAPKTQIEFEGNYLLDSGWHHIAFVVNEGGKASECECYIDGVKLGDPKVYCGDFIAQKDFTLNTSTGALFFGQNFKGQLSNFLLFDKALTPKEVELVIKNQWREGETDFSKAALADIKTRVKAQRDDIATWKNPFIKDMFTADPSARLFGDRLYVYASHDISPASNCGRMDQYHVFSTSDMKTWQDHGEILAAKDVPWGRPEGGYMWAPDCIYRNGKYYFYYPHPSGAGDDWNKTWKIGVAVSDRPDGGFDPRAEAAGVEGFKGYIEGMEPFIDPCVFIDDDGQAYIYQGGGGQCFGGKLKENMVELEGAMQRMVDNKGSKRKFRGVEYDGLEIFHEGTWVFKRNGIYYLTAPDDYHLKDGGNQLIYYTSDNPLGPWNYGGVYLGSTGCGTSHGSVVEFKGQWYAFYHNCRLSSGDVSNRSICVDKLYFNSDGSIKLVEQTY